MDELRAAAIRHDGTCDVDALLAAVVDEQRRRGRRVMGLLMAPSEQKGDCLAEMVLVDIDKRDGYLVSQSLGSASKACRADPQGFARASEVLRHALASAPDLIVCNRFGRLESEGAGFSAELLEIMSRDIPFLTVVSRHHVEDWQRFTGGAAALLPPSRPAIDAWLERTLAPASV
ncbi:DUF2478 domain-containing protein [uncultured Piscinibacter sp.]|uniref:DUF2478 domain-containing protein n=1 Tax=uncultured Piscinibacter sp. TaxID=1131835 RepID=UPI0026177D10|nr:DUF2478 domain-containing protein [uncultured Piscinibacter sp.]